MFHALYSFEKDQAYLDAGTGAGENICLFKETFSS